MERGVGRGTEEPTANGDEFDKNKGRKESIKELSKQMKEEEYNENNEK